MFNIIMEESVPRKNECKKFAANSEGPYVVQEKLTGNTYMVEHSVTGKVQYSHTLTLEDLSTSVCS